MKLLKNKCTLLIPFYNEQDRIIKTLKLMTKVQNVYQIICVDDGSQINDCKKIKKTFPNVVVLRLEKNLGKSAAILHALVCVKTQWVFFLDADLKNLQISEIETAIKTVLNANQPLTLQKTKKSKKTKNKPKPIDMLILRRDSQSAFVTAIRHDILMSGERILKTKDALAVFKKPPSGYQLEVAINFYMMDHNKHCYWQQSSFHNSYKLYKWTLQEAIKKHKDEILGYVSYDGPIKYLQQLKNFCKNEYKA